MFARFPIFAFVLVILAGVGLHRVSAEDAGAADVPAKPVAPARAASPADPHLVAAKDGFVGTDACARCHAEAHAHWMTSSHAQTFEPVSEKNLPAAVIAGETIQHDDGSTAFKHNDDGTWTARTVGPSGVAEDFHLSHVVGRMRVQMFVATMKDGRQQVLPGMYEVPRDVWFDYTKLIFGGPGSDWETPPKVKHDEPSFWTGTVRAFGPRCARCHVSGWEPLPPRASGPRYTARQLGVDCESCHGPGQAHVQWHDDKAAGRPPTAPTDPVLKLNQLAHDRALSLCMQCHMEGDLVDRKFEVGNDIFEHVDPTLIVSPERVDPYGRVLELIYDGLPTSASRCVQEGQLTCFTCHHPHGSSFPSQLRASPEGPKLCIECHQEQVDLGRAHTGHDPKMSGASCVACHMPFLKIERGHGVVADHAISIPRLDPPGDRVAQSACVTCHDGGDFAAPDAPTLSSEQLREGYATRWPHVTPPAPWQRALAQARTGAKNGHLGLLKVLDNLALPRVVRASAAVLLKPYASNAALALMLRCKDPDPLVRASALRSLASVKGDAVDRLLIDAMADDALLVRIAAARAAVEDWERIRANPKVTAAALPILKADVEEVPDDWVRWFLLAGTYDVSGDAANAIPAYEHVARLDPFATHVRRRIKELRAGAGK